MQLAPLVGFVYGKNGLYKTGLSTDTFVGMVHCVSKTICNYKENTTCEKALEQERYNNPGQHLPASRPYIIYYTTLYTELYSTVGDIKHGVS